MQDMRTHLEKLEVQMAECERISGQATDEAKRELFSRLAEHYRVLAAEIKRALEETGC